MSLLNVLMEKSPTLAILNCFVITNNKLKNPCYRNISASISGGADSDIVLDILTKLDTDKKVKYVWFDTGLEYQATKDHLKFLEEKYGIQIERVKAIKPIPLTCRQYGQPFISKMVSNRIEALQKRNFKFEDKPFEELLDEYCEVVSEEIGKANPNRYCYRNGKYYRGCCTALRWWCNDFKRNDGVIGKYDIGYNKYLKEFMVANPPTFMISDKCCTWAKKKVVKKFKEENNIDLNVYGVRKSEGGARALAYKNCFTNGDIKGVADEYRPIFWYKNEDKEAYEQTFNVTHSKCYSCYGLKRTGCAGCPFGRNFEEELKVIEIFEPKLFKAVNNIFGDSYEYTRKYREFVKQMKENETGQLTLFDYEEVDI